MRFICLGYMDESKWGKWTEAERMTFVDECLAYDALLRKGGHFVGGEALQSAKNGVTLKHQNGEVSVIDGPFVETKEYLGGILILEARDLNHAIQLMSKHPGVRLAPFEIRPANEAMNEIIAARVK